MTLRTDHTNRGENDVCRNAEKKGSPRIDWESVLWLEKT
jgi:hypothetical protein